MKLFHIILLAASSLSVVAGTFLKLQYQQETGLYLRDAGIIGLVIFIILFYKHLKSKNETTSK